MEAKLIDLNDYVRTGEGANGASYNHKSDPNIMMKLYFRNFDAAKLELELAQKVYKAGIPTPEPGDLVTDGTQVGIRFRRLVGKRSYSRACGDNPGMAPEYGREFAQLCKKLHATHIDTTQFENVKDRLYKMLDENPFFTDAEKEKLRAFIAAQPDTDTAIHGDLQFGNGIFVEDEEGVRTPYFIDLGDFCYGYPLFDVGMVYLCCCLNNEAWTLEVNHMTNATAREFWNGFAREYFESDDLDAIEQMILPYAGLKVLIIERDTHCRMPEFHAPLEKTILKD